MRDGNLCRHDGMWDHGIRCYVCQLVQMTSTMAHANVRRFHERCDFAASHLRFKMTLK